MYRGVEYLVIRNKWIISFNKTVFDNLQNSKIKEAGIPGITSVEVTEIKDQEITYYGLDENGKYSNITVKTEELVNGKKVARPNLFNFKYSTIFFAVSSSFVTTF